MPCLDSGSTQRASYQRLDNWRHQGLKSLVRVTCSGMEPKTVEENKGGHITEIVLSRVISAIYESPCLDGALQHKRRASGGAELNERISSRRLDDPNNRLP